MGLSKVILLDTHAVLWTLFDPSRLSSTAKSLIEEARVEGGLAISSVTLFEAAHVVTRKRIVIDRPLEALLTDITLQFVVKEINIQIAITSAQLTEPYPRDPMDRLIGATAIIEGIPLVTADERIRKSGKIQTIW